MKEHRWKESNVSSVKTTLAEKKLKSIAQTVVKSMMKISENKAIIRKKIRRNRSVREMLNRAAKKNQHRWWHNQHARHLSLMIKHRALLARRDLCVVPGEEDKRISTPSASSHQWRNEKWKEKKELRRSIVVGTERLQRWKCRNRSDFIALRLPYRLVAKARRSCSRVAKKASWRKLKASPAQKTRSTFCRRKNIRDAYAMLASMSWRGMARLCDIYLCLNCKTAWRRRSGRNRVYQGQLKKMFQADVCDENILNSVTACY